MREVVAKAEPTTAPAASPCGVPASIERVDVAGSVRVTEFGGKRMQLAVGSALDGQLLIYAGATIEAGRTALRPRRDAEDFDRAIVVELAIQGRALDAVAGTLVLEQTKPTWLGHLENAEFRERRDDFGYVTSGCTTQLARAELRFEPTTP